MLTRIEIEGFKSFEDFHLDLSPFVVILGPNATGKSNLFDGIQFLSNLASKDLREAVKGLRGEVDELFRHASPGTSETTMCLAAEVLIDPTIQDPWGTQVKLTHTRIRYQVKIERRIDERGIKRLVIAEEEARPILARDDRWKNVYNEFPESFKKVHFKYSRRVPWLETKREENQVSFHIRQDGKAGRTRPAHIPEATVLSSITTTEFPHLFALREEMRSWRFLQLDPAALRRPSPMMAPEMLLPDGSNLAAVLWHIKAETQESHQPKGSLVDIASELATLIPGILDVDVIDDQHTKEYRAHVKMRDGFPFPTRVISDGTLRVLAFLTLLYDPKRRGLICFEEPENGVHPARLRTLIKRLQELVNDPALAEEMSDAPLTQLLMNSHSPVVLSVLKSAAGKTKGLGQIFFADLVGVTDPATGTVRRKTRIRPVIETSEYNLFGVESGEKVDSSEVDRYLSTVDMEG
ncbi:MAG: AAA family ATPase [Deltaproteobacteria bacterium]|nr:AAA family ATPase [Deltaproteobacteria bacterium]